MSSATADHDEGGTAELRSRTAGFTLIELLIVITLLGLLAAIALPRLDDARGRAHFTSIVSDFRELSYSQERYFQLNMSYGNLGDLDFLPSEGVQVQVTEATVQGWAAVGTHQALDGDKGCSIYLGDASAPALPDGQPHPSGPGVTECAR